MPPFTKVSVLLIASLSIFPQIYADSLADERLAQLFEKAEQGDAEAQTNLGIVYKYGSGVTKNATESVKWFRKAADQGHAEAQYKLGWCYKMGEGVRENVGEAVKWVSKAAEQGHDGAIVNMGAWYSEGNGVSKNSSEAVKWYRKAAKLGGGMAQIHLGSCYEHGIGVPIDVVEAYALYNLASAKKDQGKLESGFPKYRDSIANKMTPEQIAAGEKRTKELQEEFGSN